MTGWIALATDASGVALLYSAWSAKGRSRRRLAIGGWLLVATSFAAWAGISGWEYAAVYVCVATAVFAWAVVFFRRQSKPSAVNHRPRDRVQWPGGTRIRRVAARLIVFGPLAFLSSATAGLVLVGFLPGDPADRLALGSFGFLIGWALWGVWVAAAERLRAPALAATGVIAANVALLTFVP